MWTAITLIAQSKSDRLYSGGFLQGGDGQQAVDTFGVEKNSIAHVGAFEHRRLLDPEHHCHGRHVKIGDGAVLERDLAGILVYFAYHGLGHRLGWSRFFACSLERFGVERGMRQYKRGHQEQGFHGGAFHLVTRMVDGFTNLDFDIPGFAQG